MPELPEVETIRRDLAQMVCGLTIKEVVVKDGRVIRQKTDQFVHALCGKKIAGVLRRGKALILDLSAGYLIVQPMMTGQLVVLGSKAVPDNSARVIFSLSKNTTLVYNDQRLFGRLEVVEAINHHAHLRVIGPEPLEKDFTKDALIGPLAQKKMPIKPALLDHRLVAGIGNIYASEILFAAGLDPRRPSNSLDRVDVACLYRSIRQVLRKAVSLRGTSMRNYRDGSGREGRYQQELKVYGRDGRPCLSCGTMIKKIVQAQRSTFYCAACQK